MIEKIEEISGEEIIIIKKDTYSNDMLKKARNMFLSLCRDGIIKQGLFSQSNWIVFNEVEPVKISFDLDRDLYNEKSYPVIEIALPDMINMLKSYVTFIINKCPSRLLQRDINCIRTVINNIEDNERNLNKRDLDLLEQFFEFINIDEEIAEMIFDNLELGKRKNARKQRDLSDVLSYFIHIEEINYLWEHGSLEERLYYFPIYFWANVSFIIPMRVTEMVVTPFNCIRSDGDKYFITIRKSKLKGYHRIKSVAHKVDKDFYTIEYPITKKLAENINYYSEKTKINPRPFLFDYEYGRKSINKLYPSYTFRKLLYQFYNEFLCNSTKYKFALSVARLKQIERVSLGDSRHIAIINLQEQGQPLVRCKEIAGHKSINSTAHYASNTNDFIECISIIAYDRLVRKHNKKRDDLFKYILAQNNNVEGDRCMSEKRIRDASNIDDCIATGHIEDCLGCPYRKVSNVIVDDEYKKFKNLCKRADEELITYIEQHRKSKGFDNELNRLLLELQNKSSIFMDCCNIKYKGELQKWEEEVTIKQEI